MVLSLIIIKILCTSNKMKIIHNMILKVIKNGVFGRFNKCPIVAGTFKLA